MLGSIRDFFMDKALDALLDKLNQKKDRKQLIEKITISYDKYFKEKFENLLPAEDFDLNALHEFLIENLYSWIAACFIAPSYTKRSFASDRLFAQAYTMVENSLNSSNQSPKQLSRAQKQHIYAYVDSFLNIIKQHFLSKIEGKDLFIANIQTEDILCSVKKFLENNSEDLKAYIERHGSFAEHIDRIYCPPKYQSPFHYLNPNIGFVRRKSQFEFLEAFLNDEERLRSLVITGPGGIGKSRLLHQFSLELQYDLEWKSVMLNRAQIEKISNFDEWKYPKNLLLVLDYAAETPETIGKWISAIRSSNACPQKMRIVMLERQGRIAENNRQDILPYWYETLKDACKNDIGEVEYKGGFHTLPSLNDEEISQMIDAFPQQQTVLPQKTKSELYAAILEFMANNNDERFRTPLMVLLLADAFLNKQKLLDPKHVMEYVIKKDSDHLKNVFGTKPEGFYECLECWLAYATSAGGLDIDNLPPSLKNDTTIVLDNTDEQDLKRLISLFSESNCKQLILPPMKPDIIGEYYVLNYLKTKRLQPLCQKMVSLLWKEREIEFLNFLSRCVSSYLPDFPDLVFGDDPYIFRKHPAYRAFILFALTTLDRIEITERAVPYLQKLKEKYPNNTDIPLIYAQGLVNISAKQSANDAVLTIKKLKALHEEYPDNTDITMAYAKGLVNLSNKQSADDAVNTIKALKAIHDEYQYNADIALEYASGLFNLSNKQSADNAVNTIEILKALHDEYQDNTDIALIYAKGLVNLSFKQSADDAVNTIEILKAIHDKYQYNTDIAMEYASGLVNLSNKQSADNAVNTIKTLKAIHDEYPNNTDITMEYAKGLFNMSNKQSADNAVNTIKTLKAIHDEYQYNTDIALTYAQGLVNMSAKQSADDAVNTIKTLKALHYEYQDNTDIALAYAKGLVNMSNKQSADDAVNTIKTLKAIHYEYQDNADVALIYAKGLVSLSYEQSADDAVNTIKALKAIHDEYTDNTDIALEYAKGLAILSNEQSADNAVNTIEILKTIHDEYPDNTYIALEYAKGLAILSNEQSADNAVNTIEILKAIHDEYPDNTDIALEYTKGLAILSNEQSADDAVNTIEILKTIHDEYPDNTYIAMAYAIGLFNLSNKQSADDTVHTIEILEVLYKKHPDNTDIALIYAIGLFKLSTKQSTKEATHTIEKLKSLSKKWKNSSKISEVYKVALEHFNQKHTKS